MNTNTTLITRLIIISLLLAGSKNSFSQHSASAATIDVGVAKTDITPEFPIRLTGYGARDKSETTAVIHRLEAKAMAFGSDQQHPSVLITVDLIGITEPIAEKLRQALSKKAGIDPAHVAICASHTHGGPEIGNLLNILQFRDGGYSDSLLSIVESVHIAQYIEILSKKLEEVSLSALKNRSPSLLAWGQGQAEFAANRRTKDGPVDVALPIIRVTNPDGFLKAVFLNYACHGTTYDGINQINGDWISEAKQIIEAKHPGTMAMVALGCGGDANPQPRGKTADVKNHGQEIADNVEKLLLAHLQPLTAPPAGKLEWVKLPFATILTIPDLIKLTEDKTIKGYYARSALDRIERGGTIPTDVALPVQVWNFGDQLAMINLGGEVVVDYSIRLKNELGAERLWVNAYSNDVPCYIASKRVIREGGYEVDFSMYCYDKPSPLKEEAEDIIISAVHSMMPASFKMDRDSISHPETIAPDINGIIRLAAEHATAIGPNIKYMPEWKAFGWFETNDYVEWNVNVEKAGRYEAYLDYSVSDVESGKSFAFESGSKTIKGKLSKTGSWFTYAKKKIGTVNVAAGPQKMAFRSAVPSEKGPMLDFRGVTLVPVKK